MRKRMPQKIQEHGTSIGVTRRIVKLYDSNRKVELAVHIMERFATAPLRERILRMSGYVRNKVGTARTPFLDETRGPLGVIKRASSKRRPNRAPWDPQGVPDHPQEGFTCEGGVHWTVVPNCHNVLE